MAKHICASCSAELVQRPGANWAGLVCVNPACVAAELPHFAAGQRVLWRRGAERIYARVLETRELIRNPALYVANRTPDAKPHELADGEEPRALGLRVRIEHSDGQANVWADELELDPAHSATAN